MRKSQLESALIANLGHEPTPGQLRASELLADFVTTDFQDEVFILRGYAGTGKTTLVASLVASLSQFRKKTVLLAPTGRAAKVLAGFSGKSALTIHKKIYRQKKVVEGFAEFSLDRNLHKNTLFIVDEASMIANQSLDLSIFGSGRLLDDLVSYVDSSMGCKLLLIGDTAQLPPVGLELSEALDPVMVEGYGFEVKTDELTDVVRQKIRSGILENATDLRAKIDTGHVPDYPGLICQEFQDFSRLPGAELLDQLQSSYDQVGLDETMVVCRSNKQANRYNQGIRNRILWREEELTTGEQLMVVKNNYYWLRDVEEVDFIANGDTVEINRIIAYKNLYDLRFAQVELQLKEYDSMDFTAWILLDTLTVEAPAINRESMREFFFKVMEDYQHVKGKKHRMEAVREDPFFNALQVKYAYAVTCHKAQGGQWKHIYIDQGYLPDDRINLDYYRWLYTAITRTTDQAFLVNFKDEFFADA